MSSYKDERVAAEEYYTSLGLPLMSPPISEEKQALVDNVRDALYASKICSYAQVRALAGFAPRL